MTDDYEALCVICLLPIVMEDVDHDVDVGLVDVDVVVVTDTYTNTDTDTDTDTGAGDTAITIIERNLNGCTCNVEVHAECLRTWHSYSAVCPICRTPVAFGGGTWETWEDDIADAEADAEADTTSRRPAANDADATEEHHHARMSRTIGGSIMVSTFFVWLVWFIAVQPNVNVQGQGQGQGQGPAAERP